jgi:hypothetical protein
VLAQVVLPLGLAYATAVAVALVSELARPRPLVAVLADAPRILRHAAVTIGVLAAALWFYQRIGLVPRLF